MNKLLKLSPGIYVEPHSVVAVQMVPRLPHVPHSKPRVIVCFYRSVEGPSDMIMIDHESDSAAIEHADEIARMINGTVAPDAVDGFEEYRAEHAKALARLKEACK